MPSAPKLSNERLRPLSSRYSELKLGAGVVTATLHRRRLAQVTFIGVTGSCGKTTTKELIGAALSTELRGRKSPGEGNGLPVVAKTILRTTSRDAFCVVEVAAGPSPGRVARTTEMLRPNIAVVTTIGGDHFATFRTLDATAAEKRALVRGTALDGTAVLNADDPRVLAMAEGFGGRVITFGRSPGSMLRAHDVRSSWPEPLSFTLEHEGRLLRVSTRLFGKHWVTCALAALAVAIAMGVRLERAVDALGRFDPLPKRMRPVWRDGITFIQDHVKAPFWSLDAALEFLAEAAASRKVAVIGTLSDYPGSASRKYVRVARQALEIADEVVFAGPNARWALKARKYAGARPLHAFPAVPEAAEYLRSSLREGDLVLVKGSGDADRLERVVLAS